MFGKHMGAMVKLVKDIKDRVQAMEKKNVVVVDDGVIVTLENTIKITVVKKEKRRII